MSRICAIIAAAGSGSRMQMACNKLFIELDGKSLLQRTVEQFVKHPLIDLVTVVHAEQDGEPVRRQLAEYGEKLQFVVGGTQRYESVYQALLVQPADCGMVLIHDGARPFVTDDLIASCVESCREYGNAVAGVPVKDTIKRCDENTFVEQTPDRRFLWSVQTPQTFLYKDILSAYRSVDLIGVTDDASVLERAGGRVKMIMGSYRNIKITTPEDLDTAAAYLGISDKQRIGLGYDVHAFAPDRKLILGGVEVPHKQGLLGHSDADVLVHAIMDALLGAAALGDIGRHFPDTDPAYKSISSLKLLEHVCNLLTEQKCSIINISAVVIAQAPKLAPYLLQMCENISHVTGIGEDRINIAATTTERLGYLGREEGIAAEATVLLSQKGR